MIDKANNIDIHLGVPKEMHEIWESYRKRKEQESGGLKLSEAQMIRDFVNQGIKRELKRGAK